MDQAEFAQLHQACTEFLHTWIAETTRTWEMLSRCTGEPLSLDELSELHNQRRREHDAYATHIALRQKVFRIARTGSSEPDLFYALLPDVEL